MARYIKDIENCVTFRTDDESAEIYLQNMRYDEGKKEDFIYEFIVDNAPQDLTTLYDITKEDIDKVTKRVEDEYSEDEYDLQAED